MWYFAACLGAVPIWQLSMRSFENPHFEVQFYLLMSCCVPYGICCCTLTQIRWHLPMRISCSNEMVTYLVCRFIQMTKHRSSDRDTSVVIFLHFTRTVSRGKPYRVSLIKLPIFMGVLRWGWISRLGQSSTPICEVLMSTELNMGAPSPLQPSNYTRSFNMVISRGLNVKMNRC